MIKRNKVGHDISVIERKREGREKMKSRSSSKIQEEEKIAGNENSPSVNGRKEKPSTNRTGRVRKGNKKKKVVFLCKRATPGFKPCGEPSPSSSQNR